MPIYEYQCESCGHQFDVFQRLSDPAPTECPKCDTPQIKKLVSAPSFRLKGSGWYETDFKTGKKRNVAGDDGKGKSANSASDSSAKSQSSTSESGSSGKKESSSVDSSSTSKPSSSTSTGSKS